MSLSSPSPARRSTLETELSRLVGSHAVLPGGARGYGADETEGRGVHGRPDAVALPASAQEVAAIVAWCYSRDVPIVPRGGGSGLAGGAVPVDGGVVLSLERLTAVRDFEPLLWRLHVEAGVRTADVHRLARENGLYFPPDPGAAEQSQIGGNIATNAGGPHAFKYGTTGAWVTGLEAVVAPGELVDVGGAIRKDVAGYDLRGLLVGSEGTLGVITAAWLRLIPAPAAALPVVGFYAGAAEGCRAIETVLGSGLEPAALEYLDGGALHAARGAFPGAVPGSAGFAVIAEAHGSEAEAARLRDALADALASDALQVHAPAAVGQGRALWRWRDGVSLAVTSQRGAKVSEDIAVPLDRLREAIDETVSIGRRHGLEACSWGHAGDGNLHSTFMVDAGDKEQLARAALASDELFSLAIRLGGTVTGEHGLGWVKRGQLERQWTPRALGLHEAVKRAFDPKNLLNPGKKIGRRAGD